MEKWSIFRKINFYLEKVEKKLKKSWFWNIFLDPGWKNDQILEKSTFTSKKLKKKLKTSWKKVEKKLKKEHFPGSRMEKWPNFRKINLYLEKVEKKLKKSWKRNIFLDPGMGKMIKF